MTGDARPASSYRMAPRAFARIGHLTQMERIAAEIRGISTADDKLLRDFLTYAMSDRGQSIAPTVVGAERSELFDCKAVAGIFGVNERTVRRWAAEGRLPHSSPGSTRMFTQHDLDEFRANGRRSA